MVKSHGLTAWTLGIAVLLSTSLADASNQKGEWMAMGFGAKSCGSYVSAIESQGRYTVAFLSWLQGFLSGYNLFNQDGISDVAQTDVNGLEQWILNYCRAQPTKDVSEAAIAFVKAHKSSAKR